MYEQDRQVMGVNKGWAGIGRGVVAVFLMVVLSWSVLGCAKPTAPQELLSEPTERPNRLGGQLEEVSPPETLQALKQIIDAYDPQVRILSPRPGEVLEDTTVSVRFQVRGLPLFKDQTFGLGPHLHVFLDDAPYQAVYDPSGPLVLADLAPGTHTLRVFASRPWHESFKNQGAFDQRTFHVFAQTPQKALDKNQPLLTYSRPQGTYGAEPIMLDFYLTNAPLHMIAQEDSQDSVFDWRIRCTINGQSFVFDQWQPIYLKGFKPGQNWIQLELIDENGDLIDNAFNNTVRVVTYEPGGDDALSRLVRGELTLQEVAGIIDPTYVPPAPPEPESSEPESSEPESSEPESSDLEDTGEGPDEAASEELSPSDQPATPRPEVEAPAPADELPADDQPVEPAVPAEPSDSGSEQPAAEPEAPAATLKEEKQAESAEPSEQPSDQDLKLSDPDQESGSPGTVGTPPPESIQLPVEREPATEQPDLKESEESQPEEPVTGIFPAPVSEETVPAPAVKDEAQEVDPASKSIEQEIEYSLEEIVPDDGSAAPSSTAGDVGSEPSSGGPLNQLQRWLQQYRRPTESPALSSPSVRSDPIQPAEPSLPDPLQGNEEAPIETLPEIVAPPANETPDAAVPSGETDLTLPDEPGQDRLRSPVPTKPAPASPEQLLI